MTLPPSFEVLLFLVVKAIQYVGGDVSYCPRSLYDCNSLQSGLHSYADTIITPEFMTSAFDDNYMGEICKFFKRPECSDSILEQCKGEILYASKTFRSRQQYICGDRFPRKGMRSLNSCVTKYRRHFSTCHQKHQNLLEEATYVTQTTTVVGPWCNLTKDYIICVYSIMALGCNTDVAEKYMEIVNHSAPVLEAVYRYGCSFGHPLDILKTTSPLPETASTPNNRHEAVYSPGRRSSSGSGRVSAVVDFHMYIFVQLLCLGFFAVVYKHVSELMNIVSDIDIAWSVR
ncbi:hypothetical protein BsWGS_08323 [Bradybaena similaris]